MSDGGGEYGGAAAFLGGLRRGAELGAALADRSRRQDAANKASVLEQKRQGIFANMSAAEARMSELWNEQMTKGLDDKKVQELTTLTTNLQNVRGQAHTAWTDALMHAAAEGADNPYFQQEVNTMFEQHQQLQAAHADQLKQMYDVSSNMAQEYNASEQRRLKGEEQTETGRSNVATETERKRSALEQESQGRIGLGLQARHVSVEEQTLQHAKDVDESGTYAQQEAAALGWAGNLAENRRIGVDEVHEMHANANAIRGLNLDETKMMLADQHWHSNFQYQQTRDVVVDEFHDREDKLAEQLGAGTLKKQDHDMQIDDAQQQLREKQHMLEVKKLDEMTHEFDTTDAQHKYEFEKDIKLQKRRVEALEDDQEWKHEFQRIESDRREDDRRFSRRQQELAGSRDEERVSLEARRTRVAELGFNLDTLKTKKEFEQIDANIKRVEHEYGDINDGVVAKVLDDAATTVDARIQSADGRALVDETAARTGLDPEKDQQRIRARLIAEEGDLRLGQVRAGKRGAPAAGTEGAGSTEVGGRVGELRTKIRAIDAAMETSGQAGFTGRMKRTARVALAIANPSRAIEDIVRKMIGRPSGEVSSIDKYKALQKARQEAQDELDAIQEQEGRRATR